MSNAQEIALLEAELEMERAARFSAERKLQEKQRAYAELLNTSNSHVAEQDIFLQPAIINTITEHLQTGILIENESGLIVSANLAFCKHFAIPLTPAELSGLELLQPKLLEPGNFLNFSAFLQRTNEILNNREEVRNDIVEMKNGITLERDYIPIIENTIYKGHIWYYHNTTEKSSWEKKFQTQKNLYESILSKMPADIAVFNPEHADLLLNPIAIKDAELRKWVIEWMIGKQQGTENHSGNWEEVINYKTLFKKVIQEKTHGSIEEKRINDAGETEYFLRHLYPILDESDELTMIIGYSTNITERVKAEKEMLRAKQLTENAARAKEIFLANMSHEIRTPMNGISGLAQMLTKSKLNSDQRKLVSLIQKTTSALTIIVDDILHLEKITAGELNLERITFDPIQQIKETIEPFRIKAKEKGIYLRVSNRIKQSPRIIGDPYRLSQIVNNMASNALKFTAKGGVTICIDGQLNTNHLLLQIEIKDTGIGIAKEKINQIFSPFVQAETHTGRQFGGTGLGLSICKNLITLHKGSIHVQSELGKGSIFVIHIPYPLSSEKQLDEKKLMVHQNYLTNKKILLVEDVALNSFIAASLLADHGAKVEIAENGKLAIEKLQSTFFDLVLMDISMPVMDGITATKKIRLLKDPIKANIPIIALTANVLATDAASYIAAGMQAHIVKPFSEKNLINTIVGVLNHTSVTTDLSNQHLFTKRFEGKPEFAKKMAHLFIQSAPADCKTIVKAAQKEDWNTVQRIAHRMKSSIDGMGIVSLKQTIRTIENNAKNQTNTPIIPKLTQTLNSTILNFVAQLETQFPKTEK